MKKITKLLLGITLMVATMIATSGFVHASSSDVEVSLYNIYGHNPDAYTEVMDINTFSIFYDGGMEVSGFSDGLITLDLDTYDMWSLDFTTSQPMLVEVSLYNIYGHNPDAYTEVMDINTFSIFYDGGMEVSGFSDGLITLDLGTYDMWSLSFNKDNSPVLDGDTAFITTIDDPILVSTIESYITAYDETDGSVSHLIERVDTEREFLIYIVAKAIEDGDLIGTTVNDELADYDNGTLNVTVMGQSMDNATISAMFPAAYQPLIYSDLVSALEPEFQDFYVLDYYVSDTAGNYSTLEVQVYVKDVLAPVGTDDDVTINYNLTYDLSAYLSSTVPGMFVDNYNNTSDITYSIQNDDYTSNKTIPGDYEVQFKAIDESGNVGYAILTIHVEDQVNPTFSGPTTLAKSSSESLTLSQIKSQLSANDAIDGNLTTSIQVVSDDYTGKGNLVGSYDIQFSVTDAAGNTAYHTITVQVSDDIPPVFYVRDGYFISTSSAVSLTVADVIDILEITGQISVDGSGGITVTTLVDEYSGNETTAGIYAMSFNVVKLNGEEGVYSVAIEVLSDDSGDDLVIDEDPSQFQDFIDLWHTVKDWVVNNVLWTIAAALGLILFIGGIVMIVSPKTTYKPSKKNRK